MGGKSKKQIIGYWYKWLAHFVFGKGPVDAVLELRAGGKTMWAGRATANTRLNINKPNLFGGVDQAGGQGGVQTGIDLMFGGRTQGPNDYLRQVLGLKQTGHRRKLGMVLRGGRFGAFSSNPQTVSMKVERILADWPNDAPWYPEKAIIPIGLTVSDAELGPTSNGWSYKVVAPGDGADYSSENIDASDWAVGASPFASSADHPYAGGAGFPAISNTMWPLSTNIWIRRKFHVADVAAFGLTVFVDNYATVWVNGTLVLPRSGTVSGASSAAFLHAVAVPANLLRKGENTIALLGEDLGTYSYVAFKITTNGGTATNTMNPAHALYDSIVHPDSQGQPSGSINDASFRAAADVLYDERFGICTVWEPAQETPKQFQDRIGDLIGGQVNQSRVDGLYYLDLVRDPTDDEYAALPILTESDVIEFEQQPNVTAEDTTTIIGKWRDPTTKADYSTRAVESAAAIRARGSRVVETKERFEIPTEELCLRVCLRDLNLNVLPRSEFSLTCLRRVRSLRPCQLFRLQMPSEGIADVLLVLVKINHGTLKDGKIAIEAITNTAGLPRAVYLAPSDPPWQAPDTTATVPPAQVAMEAPYIDLVALLSAAELDALTDDVGYVATAAQSPASATGYLLATSVDGSDYATSASPFEFVPTALASSAAPLTSDVTLTEGVDLSTVAVGEWALWDDEIVRIDAIDADAGTATLGRGCADTVPVAHLDGARIWFIGDRSGTDRTQYAGGDTVNAKVLTQTIDDLLDVDTATALPVAMDDRQARPYPPGQLRFDDALADGQAYPDGLVAALTTRWTHRDRITQADQLVDESAGSIGPEAGTTYTVSYYQPPGTLVHSEAGIAGTAAMPYTFPEDGQAQITVASERDGYTSLQAASHTFNYARVSGYRVTESGDRRVTEAGDPRTLELP